LRNQTFDTFWHGPELSPLHWACLKSFIQQGHSVRLFCYQEVKVPHGVSLEDASQISRQEEIFKFEDSFSAFSDLFRYKLMLKYGGWWVDTDVYCTRDDIPDCDYSWASQDATMLNGAVLKFPAGDPTLQRMLDQASRDAANMTVWEQIGPQVLTDHLSSWSAPGHFGSTEAFYPVHWLETFLFWLPGERDWVRSKSANACFIHTWASMFNRFGIDLSLCPPDGSELGSIYEQADFYRELPPMTDERFDGIVLAIKSYLDQRWLKEMSVKLLGYDVSLHDFAKTDALRF
jgi:hypothetical protein